MEEKMKYELDPCPFCGGAADLAYGGSTYTEAPWVAVECTFCFCSTDHMNYSYHSRCSPVSKIAEERAVASWNTRIKE